MPNFCSNCLVVSGSREELEEFRSLMRNEGQFQLNSFVPMPIELEGTSSSVPIPGVGSAEPSAEDSRLEAAYGASDWYSWRIQNWGCKWDTSEAQCSDEGADGPIKVWFDTPWRPPIQFCQHVSRKFSALRFVLAFAEGGMGYFGEGTFSQGTCDRPLVPCPVGDEMGAAIAMLPRINAAFHKDRPESMSEDEWYDLEEEERLSAICRAHLESFDLHTGG